MIKYNKIKEMAQSATSAKQWESDIIALAGGKKNRQGHLTFETSHKELDAREVDLGKLTNIMFNGDLDRMDDITAEGGAAQQPSQFTDISAWQSTIGGLLDMIALQAYTYAPMISDAVSHVIPRTVRGGKLPRVYTNLKNCKNVPIGTPAPTVDTLQEGWVELPYVERDAKRIKLLKEDFTFDRSGTIQQAVEDEALGLRIAKEERIAVRALGIFNDYVRDGVGLNGTRTDSAKQTYLTSPDTSTSVNGNLPFNYTNAGTTGYELLTAQNLAAAEVLMRSNKDPYSGIPIDLGDHPILLVSPYLEPTASQILWSMYNQIWSTNGMNFSGALTKDVQNRTVPNRFQVGNGTVQEVGRYRLVSSWIWYNMLTTGKYTDGSLILTEAGAPFTPLSSTDAQNLWMLVNPKAFAWLEVYPFSSVDVTIAGDDATANVVLDKYLSHYGNGAIVEPRYAGQFGSAVV